MYYIVVQFSKKYRNKKKNTKQYKVIQTAFLRKAEVIKYRRKSTLAMSGSLYCVKHNTNFH